MVCEQAPKVYNCIDKETEERHLREFPLKKGWERIYTDHTGRFFEDVDPSKPVSPEAQELFDILQKEINAEIIRSIMDK